MVSYDTTGIIKSEDEGGLQVNSSSKQFYLPKPEVSVLGGKGHITWFRINLKSGSMCFVCILVNYPFLKLED